MTLDDLKYERALVRKRIDDLTRIKNQAATELDAAIDQLERIQMALVQASVKREVKAVKDMTILSFT